METSLFNIGDLVYLRENPKLIGIITKVAVNSVSYPAVVVRWLNNQRHPDFNDKDMIYSVTTVKRLE
jgi:hypothetical protein